MKTAQVHTQPRQTGFSLIEILLAMAIFAVGMLGIAMHMGQSMKNSANNSMHAGAMQAASTLTEQLNQLVRRDVKQFQTLLQDFQTPRLLNPSISTNPGEQFRLQVLQATDSSALGHDLLSNTDYFSWRPPFTISMEVSYSNAAITHRFPLNYVLTP